MAESIIGKRIALKSNSEIRYIGTLYAIDHQSSAISLVDVLSLGTEDRITPGGFVPPANTVYPYVVFRASDVRDIAVIGDPSQGPQAPASLPLDPAIVSQGRPAAPVQQPSPFQSQQQAAPPPPPPQQQPFSSPNLAPAGPSSMMPPVAPSVATAHSTTLARLHPDSHKTEQHRQPSSAAPSRQPYGPVGIPFEQLAAQTDTHGSNRGSNQPHSHNPMQRHPAGGPARGGPRVPRGGRAPGAFSNAAQAEDLTQEFDFEGINKRFEQSRSGEAPQAPVEGNAIKGETQQETRQPPSSAPPSRQPTGPVGIPFEQLAAQIDTHGSNRGSNHPHPHNPVQRHPAGGHARGGPRAPRGGRAPGAFSHAAQSEDLTQEFDFEGMNQRFEELRSGEAPQAPVEDDATKGETQQETVMSPKLETEEKPSVPAYNKSSSFFDSVSSNIQNPSSTNNRGRGGGGGRGGGRPRNFDQHTGIPQSHPQSGFPSAAPRGPPRPAQGREESGLPPRPRGGGGAGGRNNNRRRDESALNSATFGDDGATQGGEAGMRGGRMGGRGRSAGNGRPAAAATE